MGNTTTKMARSVYLENTTGKHNKFYQMVETGSNNEFTVTWGKIGTIGQSKVYHMIDWTKILNSKLNKGYFRVVKETIENGNDWVVEKFKKLYEGIYGGEVDDKNWVRNKIQAYDCGIVPVKEELLKANKLWKKYNN